MDLVKVNSALDQCAEEVTKLGQENQFILAAGTLQADDAVSMRVRCENIASVGVLMTAMLSEISAFHHWSPKQLMRFMEQMASAAVLARWGQDVSFEELIKDLYGIELRPQPGSEQP